MELPCDIHNIIREFSKPLTRGDWKKGSPIAHILKTSRLWKLYKEAYCIYSLQTCEPDVLNNYTFSNWCRWVDLRGHETWSNSLHEN